MIRKKPKAEPFTYIHSGTRIVGDITVQGRMRVDGMIRGNVEVDGLLEVAEAGSIEGERVVAHEIKILGRVLADVTAGAKIEIWHSGRLEGNVRAAALDIEEGAVFIGRSEMNAERLAHRALTAEVIDVRPENGT
jgi:cytoskeletal protein CcmA (bactofilin family)